MNAMDNPPDSSTARGRRRASSGAQDDDAGFALIEVIVAIGVLLLMSTAVVAGLTTSTRVSGVSRDRVAAANLAQETLERLRVLDVNTIPDIAPETVVAVGGRAFRVLTSAAWVPAPSTGDRCIGAASGQNAYKKVSVQVSWDTMGTASPVRTDTLLNAPSGLGAPNTGAQRVRVLSASGAPVTNLPVTLMPITSGATAQQTVNTDSYGCVVFSPLADGDYRVQADTTSSVPRRVDVAGSSLHQDNVSVTGLSAPPVVEFLYDAPVGLSVTPALPGGYALPTHNGDRTWAPGGVVFGATVANTAMRPSGFLAQPGYAFPTLFPFAGGYHAWLGTCADADPNAVGGIRTAVPVPPPATAVALPVQPVTITIYSKAGKRYDPVGGVYVAAVHAGTNGCGPRTAYITPSATVIAGQNYYHGPSPSTGAVKTLLPFGEWTFYVYGYSLDTAMNTAWPKTVLKGAADPDLAVYIQ